jgi:ABC-2 type transport system permease protein
MIVKEFRQLRRDRRTLAMMVVLPIGLLVAFGYAATFDVSSIATTVVGPQAETFAQTLQEPFVVERVEPADGREDAENELRDGDVVVSVVTGDGAPVILIDGSDLFPARAAQTAIALMMAQSPSAADQAGAPPTVEVLYNPKLETAAFMVPGLAGMILIFIGTITTSIGVVRERQAGTLEQLAVMPFRPSDVFVGKIAPYFLVAAADLVIVIIVGILLFDVPFRGSVFVLGLGSLLFLLVTLGTGVLISSVSQNQGQAIQLAMMAAVLPQMLLSGVIFPLSSIPIGVRWLSYLMPLTYFTEIARGVMLRGEPIETMWQPFLLLVLLGTVVMGLAMLRFRAYLAPSATSRGR